MKPDDEAYVNPHERLRERERVIIGTIPTPMIDNIKSLLLLLAVSMITVGAAIFWAWVALKVGLWLFR